MPRPPDQLLKALRSHLWLEGHTSKYPKLGPVAQDLLSVGFIEVVREELVAVYPGSIARSIGNPGVCSYVTRVSAEGKEALATHLTELELLNLIREGISFQAFAPAAPFVKELPKELLPELLACGSNEVQWAASERLERLNEVDGVV